MGEQVGLVKRPKYCSIAATIADRTKVVSEVQIIEEDDVRVEKGP